MMDRQRHGTENENKRVHSIISPPVIADMDSPGSAMTLRGYIGIVSDKGSVWAAQAEAERLAPYFGALSRRLRSEDVSSQPADRCFSAGMLSGIFVEAARKFGNTLVSDVAVLPQETMENHLQDCRIISHDMFDVESHYNGKKINFGFLQIFQKDDNGKSEAGISVPVLGLDRTYMKSVADMGGQSLLDDLQKVATWGNHDMLHHYTSRILTPKAARKLSESSERHVRQWYDRYAHQMTIFPNPLDYERWAVLSHSRTWEAMRGEPAAQDVYQTIDRFPEKLAALSERLEEQEDMFPYKRHAIIDYFGMAMAFCMTRLMALDDPVFDSYLEKLQNVDPDRTFLETDLLKGRDVIRYLCDDIDRQRGKHHAGYRRFAEIMTQSGLDTGQAFRRTLYSLSEVTGLERDELTNLAPEEFYNLLFDELDTSYDSVFSERVYWDIRSFAGKVFDYNLPETHAELSALARENLPLLLEERWNSLKIGINNGEGTVRSVTQCMAPDNGVALAHLCEKGRDDYISVKKLQLAGLTPGIVYMHSKPEPGTRLEQACKQIADQDRDMVRAVVRDLGMRPS